MIKTITKIPHEVCLAFSGGVDSLAAAHFLSAGKKKVTLLHFNHGCEYSNDIAWQCQERAKELNLPLFIGHIGESSPPKGESIENFWRRARYKFLRNYANSVDQKLITCHHLDDAVETWVWSSMHGEGKVIPVEDNTVIRPFILTEKQAFIDYAASRGLVPVDDPYNEELHLTRNYIRANMMSHVYHINPGIKKVIRKKYLNN